MNEHELFKKTFSTLHASDHTLQAVMTRVHSGKGAKGISKRIVVLAAALAMLFSMGLVAYGAKMLTESVAVLTPAENPAPALDGAFGDKVSTQKPNLKGGDGKPIVSPDMERIPVDPAEAEKLVGAYVYDVDGVLTVGENTLTFQNFLIDETGCGTIMWILENPNGVIYRDSGYGGIYFPHENPLLEPELRHYGADGTRKSGVYLFNTLLSRNEEGTRLELVSHFGTAAEYQTGDSFAWEVNVEGSRNAKRIHITPVECIPAKTMTAAEEMQLRITNQSITINEYSNDRVIDRLIVHFKDGTQYCVCDGVEKIRNTPGTFVRKTATDQDDGTTLLFNRLIDTDQVASVEMTVNVYRHELVGETYKTEILRETAVFYP